MVSRLDRKKHPKYNSTEGTAIAVADRSNRVKVFQQLKTWIGVLDVTFVKLYFIALPVFFAIDLLWIGLVAKNFYAQQIGFLMRTDVNWVAAVLFYLLFIVGLVIFVIAPAVEKSSWTQALLLGGLFGLIAYATYDLTNLATVKNWPLIVTVIDLIWGSVLASAVSTITYFISSKIGL